MNEIYLPYVKRKIRIPDEADGKRTKLDLQ